MQEKWQATLEVISRFLKEDLDRYSFFLDIDSLDVEQRLSKFKDFFLIEEKNIKKEHQKNYVTDFYEYETMSFAMELIQSLIPIHGDLKAYESYKELLGQRHIAYGFYSSIHLFNNIEPNIYYDILKDRNYAKVLYGGLVEFFENFYGQFHNNETAIKLLCEFYVDIGSTENVVGAIYRHITNAGTPGDLGFAYNGIEMIIRHIGKLPIEIIDELLKKYKLYEIINNKVYRNQVFQIIENSVIDPKEKPKYKFTYLDSLLIANSMNRSLYDKYGQDKPELTPQYHLFEVDLSVPKIGLIEDPLTDGIYAYWTNECSFERSFVVDGKIVISISLDDNNRIMIKYNDKPTIKKEFDFKYTDWTLNYYQLKEYEEKLQNFVFELGGEEGTVYNNLTFSLLYYLNDSRGVSSSLLDFDHKFTYDKLKKELRESTTISPIIPHFYGEKIYSLSCIVGKNGTGKTSMIDFLRDTFFKLLYLIADGLVCKNGYVSEKDYGVYKILDKGCEFLVVFNLDDQPYFLTNIEDLDIKTAQPFDSSGYKSDKELSKVVYFSNMLSANNRSLYIDESGNSRNETHEERLMKALKHFRWVDYSESASFIKTRRMIAEEEKEESTSPPEVNKELLYQLNFLSYLGPNKLREDFEITNDKEFIIRSDSLGTEDIGRAVDFSLKRMMVNESERLKSFLISPGAKLDYFSSGQYAKFSFISKLYWFLGGYKDYIEDFEMMVGDNAFDYSDVLLDGKTALIFIDEGELYYHPEWQRGYIKTLVDYVNDASPGSKLQVVITTNSPFILSDILDEDITYLSKKNKEFGRTLGQNIHKLLKDNFFMSFTIGEYSRELIERIIGWLGNCENDFNGNNKIYIGKELSQYFGDQIEEKDYYEKIFYLIDKIGEPIYREKLHQMLKESGLSKRHERERLLSQMSEIERKLKMLGDEEIK